MTRGEGYSDIQDAYDQAANGDTIEAWAGLHGQRLLFDKPMSVKLIGGYDDTFTTHSGATIVGEKIEIRNGSIELANIVIQ